MQESYDMVVVGAGNAGMGAAGVALAEGWSVLVADRRDFGGTCALRGCVPKKVLVAAAEVLDTIARAGSHHIEVGTPRLSWQKLIERKETFVTGVPDDFENSLTKRGADVAHAPAAFRGRHEILVGDQTVRFDKAVVATGSVPRKLPFPGSEQLLTSEDILVMQSLPESIAFVGAGVIACELAHVLARAGVKVTLLEMQASALANFDQDAVRVLMEKNRGLGIELVTKARVQKVQARGGGYAVEFSVGGESRELRVAAVAHGAGRVPSYAELDLPAADVELDDDVPLLDSHLGSRSNPDVLFAGDAVPSSPQLSPVASYEGKLAGRNALASRAQARAGTPAEQQSLEIPYYAPIPAVVFTVPALAKLGLTEHEARRLGYRFDCITNDMTGWRSGRTYAETEAFSKLLISQDTREVLGAHLVGHGAQETIHAFAFLMRHALPVDELDEMVAAYPTFHADLKNLV